MKRSLLILICILSTYQINAQNQATFYTNQGDFVLELYDINMPITSGNFKDLVAAKFYDSTIFHRVISNFVIQGGNAALTGGGTAAVIQDEFDANTSNTINTISMANSGPNSGTSQFFINLKDNTGLDFDKAPLTSKHPVFGVVISGNSVVQAIGAVPTGAGDRPVTDVLIDSIRMTYEVPLSLDNVTIGESNIRVYPNPVSERTSISFIAKEKTQGQIQILDMNGKVVQENEVQVYSGLNKTLLNVSNNLPNGLYILKLEAGKTLLRSSFLKR